MATSFFRYKTAGASGVANTEVRCAIYTRKSTEEGLSQEFNSLDAQREAAESYIQSQRGLGWNRRSHGASWPIIAPPFINDALRGVSVSASPTWPLPLFWLSAFFFLEIGFWPALFRPWKPRASTAPRQPGSWCPSSRRSGLP